MKVLVSELYDKNQEASIYHLLSRGPAAHSGKGKISQIFDTFTFEGPNGVHQCLVLELLGASMASISVNYAANRLPGNVAWKVARQVAPAIFYMHEVGIVYGGKLSLALSELPSTKLRFV
jgi:3-hydroxy-3-methylglutaryl CoA synthase